MSSNKVLILELSCLFLVGTFFWYYFNITVDSHDYREHARIAHNLRFAGELTVPHFVYHYLLIFIQTATDVSYRTASLVIVWLAKVLTLVIIYLYLVNSQKRSLLAVILAITLVLVNPIQLLALIDTWLDAGYIYINVYHNPTIELLKPVALLLFILLLNVLLRKGSRTQSVAILLLAVIASFIKPSFSMIAMPAAIIMFIYDLAKDKRINIDFLLFIVVTAVCLSLQLWLYGQSEDGRIAFMPFAVMSMDSRYLLLKFLLSSLFLFVAGFAFPATLRGKEFCFLLVLFISAMGFTYLFAESGFRFQDRNFVWCGQIALMLAFVYFGKKVLDEIQLESLLKIKSVAVLVALVLHVSGGVFWMYKTRYYNFLE